MSDIRPYNDDLFAKYEEYRVKDTATSDQKLLSDEDRALVDKCLNTSFLNPKFKMEHFVTSGQLTPYGTVRQWMLELKSMEENCEQFEALLKKHDLEEKIYTLELEREQDELEKARIQLKLDKVQFDRKQNRRRLAQHYIEREQYIQLINEYLEGPNGKTPEGKSWLEVFGNMDEENRWEAHYWQVRLARQAAMDIVSYGRVGAGNMDAVCQLPSKMQEETIALTHEMTLRLETYSGSVRQQVHERLMQTDADYARIMAGKRPDDLNKVEFDLSKMTPTAEVDKTEGEELTDVYVHNN